MYTIDVFAKTVAGREGIANCLLNYRGTGTGTHIYIMKLLVAI